jgi:hypothetical protein
MGVIDLSALSGPPLAQPSLTLTNFAYALSNLLSIWFVFRAFHTYLLVVLHPLRAYSNPPICPRSGLHQYIARRVRSSESFGRCT